MKPSKALELMQYVLKGGNSPFLLGGTGVGKSAVVRELANRLADGAEVVVDEINPSDNQFGFIDFRLSLYESVDLGGLPYIKDVDETCVQGRAFLGNLPIGGRGLLFFDEYAQAHGSVQAIVGQLVYENRLGEYSSPEGWHIVCAGNRASDRAGSNKLPSHVVGRTSVIDFEHDTNDWLAWASENDVHMQVTGFISREPHMLNVFDPKVTTPQASPRAWTRLSDTLKTNPDISLWQDIAKCDVGETAAIEFCTFVSLSDQVPDLEAIVRGDDVEIPDNVGILYATIVALVTVIREASDLKLVEYFENALDYVSRFQTPEYSIFFVRSLVGAKPELKETSAYAKFKVDNQDLTI